MGQIIKPIASILVVLFYFEAIVHATGIGVFGSVAGDQRLKLFTGGGLIIDTNCATDKLFNYRLAIGGNRFIISRDETLADPSNLDLITKFSFLNTFGFGLVRKESFRFWLGPQIGVHTRYFRSVESIYGKLLFITSGYPMYYLNGPESMVGVSGGLIFGFNFNFSHNITMSIELGSNYYLFYGINNQKTIFTDPLSVMDNNSMSKYNYLDINASIAILYRINDSFSAVNLK